MGIIVIAFIAITAIYLISIFLLLYFRKKEKPQKDSEKPVITPVINIIYDVEESINDNISEIAEITLKKNILFSQLTEKKTEEKAPANAQTAEAKYEQINFKQFKKINV